MVSFIVSVQDPYSCTYTNPPCNKMDTIFCVHLIKFLSLVHKKY